VFGGDLSFVFTLIAAVMVCIVLLNMVVVVLMLKDKKHRRPAEYDDFLIFCSVHTFNNCLLVLLLFWET
jgi:hypothetical protein